MKVIVLAAGYGTRLKEIAENTPKPLLPINGKPMLNYIVDRISTLEGLNEILVVTNNKFFGHFTEWKESLPQASYDVTIVNDGTNSPEERLGSIGDIHFTLENQNVDDDVLVIGGDNLFDYNVDDYIIFARDKSPSASIGVYDIEDMSQAHLFGIVEIDNEGKLLSFEEKPEQPKSTLVAMCFYYFPKDSLGLVGQYLSETEKSDKAGDYIRWLHENSDVYGFKFSGKWYDIGSVEAYHHAQENFK